MSVADEIEKLADLRSKGVLSEEEFVQAKERVISSQVAAASNAPPAPLAAETSAKRKGMGTFTKILLWIGGAFVAFLIFGATVGNTPEARERQQQRDSIKLCWQDQGRKSYTPGTQQFVAGVCEKLEEDYRKKWRSNP